jgi:transaldolase
MTASTNPLRRVHQLGQSLWLDDIRRSWLRDGTFSRLIEQDALAGVTSNPAIFAKSIAEDELYREAIRAAAGGEVNAVYESLVLDDVQAAADLFLPLYRSSGGTDGFVSLEVSPHLADDTDGTIAEGRRLWAAFNRPNAMIKVPGTLAGLPAIRQLLADGINVNVTLLFSVARYAQVLQAYMDGLSQRLKAGQPIDHVASVASFFLSRIDSLVDGKLDALGSEQAQLLRGRAAIASAQLAYQHFLERSTSEQWQTLSAAGAKVQRLLWASTSSKDPAYSDVKYVEALIAEQTVNTLPPATLEAYRDHGQPEVRIADDLSGAQQSVNALKALGIDMDEVSEQLEREGVDKFKQPFDALLAQLRKQLAE